MKREKSIILGTKISTGVGIAIIMFFSGMTVFYAVRSMHTMIAIQASANTVGMAL